MAEYLIQGETISDLANHTRRILNTTGKINVAEILEAISRTQGSVNTDGKYLIQAFDYEAGTIKAGMYNSGEIFALPEPQRDFYQNVNGASIKIAEFQQWVATSPIKQNYIVVNDMPVNSGMIYKPVDDCVWIIIEIADADTKITLRFTTTGNNTINWGDGSVESYGQMTTSQTHIYTDSGTYVIKIPKSDILLTTSLAEYDTGQLIKAICIPKWLSDNVNSLIDRPFSGLSNLEYLLLEEGVEFRSGFEIENLRSLKSLVLPRSVASSIDLDLSYNGIEQVILPCGMTEIPSFYGCENLRTIIIPSGATSIKSFNRCSNLTSITLPNTITIIPTNCFAYCNNLSEVVGLDNVISIEENAFHCNVLDANNALTELILPSVTSIGPGAFQGLEGLKTVVLSANNICELTGDSGYLFSNFPNVYVPDALVDAYKSATNWSVYASQIKPLSEYTATT